MKGLSAVAECLPGMTAILVQALAGLNQVARYDQYDLAQTDTLMSQDGSFRMLAALGIAAVGCTTTTSFTQSDADRFTALTHLTPSVPESLDPIQLPPSRPAPAPLGPISYNTLPAQQNPTAGPLQTDGQRSGSLAAARTTSSGSRGRPAKEAKLSGVQVNCQ